MDDKDPLASSRVAKLSGGGVQATDSVRLSAAQIECRKIAFIPVAPARYTDWAKRSVRQTRRYQFQDRELQTQTDGRP